MALTKLTETLNKISTLATTIRGQATTVKAAFDHDVNIIKDYINDELTEEIDDTFETKDNIATNRKLSDTGNFTGTWHGYLPVETDPGIQAVVDGISNFIEINIMNFGAVPSLSDITTATANAEAIQDAVDYAYNKGGGIVKINDGKLFYVKPDIITLKSNVTILSDTGKLKIPSNIGDYWTLFTFATNHSNIKVINLTIDMNDTPSANPSANISMVRGTAENPLVGMSHATFYGGGISDLYIEGCKILNSAGVNTILVDGYNTAKNATVKRNYFHWVRGVGSTYGVAGWYDNTVLYLQNYENVTVEDGNVFESDIASRCNCCLDVGKINVKVQNNTSKNCLHFMDMGTGGNNFVITSNSLYNVSDGIKFWSNTENVIIQCNKMFIDPEIYISTDPNSYGNGFIVAGVVFSVSGNQQYKNIKIYSNIFEYVAETYSSSYASAPAIIQVYGATSGVFNLDNIDIKNNTFNNISGRIISLVTGTNGVINANIKDNAIRNSGYLYYSWFVSLNVSTNDSIIEVIDNNIYNSNSDYATWLISNTALPTNKKNILVKGNRFHDKNFDNGLCDSAIEDVALNLIGVFDLANKFYANLNSDVLNVYTGDSVLKADGVYEVTGFGTYGTITGITVTGTLVGYGLVNASGDLTQIKAGNVFTVAGHTEKKWMVSAVDYANNKIFVTSFSGVASATVTAATLTLVAPTDTKLTT